MISRLFWKTWISLWLILILTYVLSGLTSELLRTLDESQDLRERPWHVVETLAIEAERVADQGGDLTTWSQLPSTNRMGRVYIFDQQGIELNGLELPAPFRDASLRPFARKDDVIENHDGAADQPEGLARTVFLSGQEEPMTLIFLPRKASTAWSDGIPTILILTSLGLILTAIGAWLFSRHMVLPVRALFLASERVAKGDFSIRPGTMFGSRNDELGQLARRFDQMIDKLGRVSEFQKTLLRDVSHELRSPLARLQVAAELVGEQYSQQPSSALQRIEKEIRELESLIEEILSLTKFDHDPKALSRTPTDLGNTVKEVVEDANFTAASINKLVELQYCEMEAVSRIDSKLIKSALQNIVANAVQYSRPETTIVVTLRGAEQDWIICVSDKGPGVPETELEAIFRPFYRSHSGRSWRGSGHGVGLAMVARIVQAHEGEVSAKNRIGGGLEVTMSLPMAVSQ